MITELSAALGSLKATADIVRGLNATATHAKIDEVKISLGQHILDAQAALIAANEAQTVATQRIHSLEDEVALLKDWMVERQRYELKRYWPGTLAYALKPGLPGNEPPHMLCPNCFHSGKKSILQATTEIRTKKRMHLCQSCKAESAIGEEMPTSASVVEPNPRVESIVFSTDRYDPFAGY